MASMPEMPFRNASSTGRRSKASGGALPIGEIPVERHG
jgi:hypothetical protein